MVNQLESPAILHRTPKDIKDICNNHLQNIIFPRTDICTVEELFFRSNSQVLFNQVVFNYENQILELNQGGIVSFDTYFNAFYVDSWKEYTQVRNISASVKLKGTFKISVYNIDRLGETKTVLSQKIIKNNEIEEIKVLENFDISTSTGMIYLKIEALENLCQISGGYFSTLTEPVTDVKIAVVICTYKRENYVYKNIKLLEKYLLKPSIIENKLEVFIIDNGKTLEKFDNDLIHVIPNKNAGGSGGFARGMLEVLKQQHNQENEFSHIILMDDDILFDPEILERVWNFLTFSNQKDVCLGSSMLRLDKKYIQHEKGAYWNRNQGFIPVKPNMDLRKLKETLFNEVDEYIDYAGWWFFCFPVDAIKDYGLPYPFFIKIDDVEFCRRIGKKIIILNGICVWHEPFENKKNPSIEYYFFRNSLIYHSLYFHKEFSSIKAIKWFLKPLLKELFCYRYETAESIIKGTVDFLQGPDVLVAKNPEENHQEVCQSTEKTTKNPDLPFVYKKYLESREKSENKLHRFFRLLTLNGHLLPNWFFFADDTLNDKGYCIVPASNSRPLNAFRTKKVLYYNLQMQEGFVVKFSRTRFFKVLINALWVSLLMFIKLPKLKTLYIDSFLEFTSQAFWEKYLEIETK
ncbi:glycosyltransferase [Sphaerospermopsis sp. FACHB-1194]|uniref:glycosyltransferase n=1 Tax=Sphaerospermopsis sp. FACHB-1194 TaxID=2692862 RepID=UPI0016802214|nr:glycosyltransferase [Sphaerospermopsis sp. FACHB-1194]MBD2146200.1 glycosyltransferase [Sphaerospermopsis sp. FACHB-1194]